MIRHGVWSQLVRDSCGLQQAAHMQRTHCLPPSNQSFLWVSLSFYPCSFLLHGSPTMEVPSGQKITCVFPKCQNIVGPLCFSVWLLSPPCEGFIITVIQNHARNAEVQPFLRPNQNLRGRTLMSVLTACTHTPLLIQKHQQSTARATSGTVPVYV